MHIDTLSSTFLLGRGKCLRDIHNYCFLSTFATQSKNLKIVHKERKIFFPALSRNFLIIILLSSICFTTLFANFNKKIYTTLTSSLWGIPVFVYNLKHQDIAYNHCCRNSVQQHTWTKKLEKHHRSIDKQLNSL